MVTAKVAAGNYKDVLLYESWDNPYIIRFVDINGNVVYSEKWTSASQITDLNPPNPPVIEGYVGNWEKGWEDKLKNVTADVTIKPVYVIEEYADDEDHVHLDSTSNAKEAFVALEKGNSVIIGADLSGTGNEFGISGGKNSLCVMDDGVTGRLNINSFKFSCTFDHNANKSWHVFDITEGSKLTISGGASGEGVMVVTFEDIKSNVYLFNIDATSTLELEAGLRFEINCDPGKENMIYGFMINGKVESFGQYDGILVERSSGKIIITVGVTTTITATSITTN